MFRLKRVFDPPSEEDGFRALVDRLWPRGMTKEKAALDLWLKDVAPSTELRKWFGHDPSLWDEFCRRYREELEEKPESVEILREKGMQGTVTLLFAYKDLERNQAVVLREYLEGMAG